VRKTFLERTLSTSISDNGLILPPNALGEHIKRYSFPALFQTTLDNELLLSKGGSVTKVKRGGRLFVVTAYHVVAKSNYELTQLCLPQIAPHRFVTSHGARFPVTHDAQEEFDFIAFEFTEAVEAGLLAKSDWFDASADLARTTDIEAILIGCVGYPSHRNNISYDEMTYAIGPNLFWGNQVNSVIDGRGCFKPLNPISYEPFGMSGAPVFGLELRGTHLFLALVGILTNASSTTFNWLCCTNPMRDSSCESSVVAGLHEQTHIPRLQDQELARIQ